MPRSDGYVYHRLSKCPDAMDIFTTSLKTMRRSDGYVYPHLLPTNPRQMACGCDAKGMIETRLNSLKKYCQRTSSDQREPLRTCLLAGLLRDATSCWQTPIIKALVRSTRRRGRGWCW